ncbi:hypothetical protein R5R35_010913 [Gryllus longicercus]|uniref:GPI inositol-deacylase n=1 Tax=Gryllus longicercus TaxID=2509291 RepID=A0AAN9V2V6_9ORTH
MAAINAFVVACGLVFLFFIAGLHNYITNFEENGCEMTYMFEYPQYVKIALPPDISSQFSRYGLYAYGEGKLTDDLRKMKFTGIPVLFIPGNSGSYKQARSLASVSLRKAINSHLPYHFDYFTVDLNDEYSGLFGGILEDQTDFVHHCILRILELYRPSPFSPVSVVLIGHSMGGMVAKGLFLNPQFNPRLVEVIITLATPHKAPVLLLDRHLVDYHSKVDSFWRAQKNNTSGNIGHVTLVSIGGGQRDILVKSVLTQAEEADISVLSTQIPGVWLSTDHLSTLWCKELILVIVRALFDIVDVRSKQISHSQWERKHAFEYHLLKRTAGKRLALAFHGRETVFNPDGMWNEYLRRQFSVVEPYGVPSVMYVMIRLVDDPKHEWLLAEAINVEANDWVFACTANEIRGPSRICNYGVNLSNQTRFMPSTTLKRKIVYLHLREIKKLGFSHVILRVLPTREMVQINVDIHSSARKVNIPLPLMLRVMKHQPIIESTDDGALHYSLAFPSFEHIWQAYYLHISPYSCRLATHHAIGIMHVPWSQEDLYVKINDLVEKPMQLRLQTARPLNNKGDGPVVVNLILDPTCRYSISIQSALLDSLGQIVRFYGPMILPYVAAVLLLTLRSQMLSLAETRSCTMFHSALASGAKPYYILPIVKMASRVLSVGFLVKLMQSGIKQFDPVTLVENNLDFILLPFVLYMVAFATAYIIGLACWLAVIFNGTAANKIALRFLARTITGTIMWSEWMLAGLAKLPITAAGFLIALSYSTCGALSLCVGGAFYFLKLCKMYEEYLEELFKFSIYLLSRFKKGGKSKKKEKEEEPENKENELNRIPETVNANDSEDEKDKIDSVDENEEKNEERKEEKNSNGSKKAEEQERESSSKTEEENREVIKKEASENKDDKDTKENKNAEEKSGQTNSSASYSLSELHFNFTLLLLWVTVTVVNIPAVLVWAHNYGYSTKLQPDPSFETGVVLCFCVGVLWQKKAPNPHLKHYPVVGHMLYLLAVLILIFSTLSLHHLSPLLMVAFVIVTVHQMIAESLPIEESEIPSIDTEILDEKAGTNLPFPSSEKPKQA